MRHPTLPLRPIADHNRADGAGGSFAGSTCRDYGERGSLKCRLARRSSVRAAEPEAGSGAQYRFSHRFVPVHRQIGHYARLQIVWAAATGALSIKFEHEHAESRGEVAKAAAHAEAKKVDPSVLLNMRVYPDMFPLVRQVRAATDHAMSACGRLAGVELPTFANTESSIPELKDRIAKAIEFIKSIKPAQIDGSEDKEITIKFASGERKFTGQSLLLNFCLPNFYFHATTAYDILRHCGVEVGKRDFMGTPVAL